MDTESYIQTADERVDATTPDTMSLQSYLEHVSEHPEHATHAAQYIVNAIEHFGTRQVNIAGTEHERYRFFDDPANDGEHAVIGHTKTLNRLVDELRAIAEDDANTERMLSVFGPTATGKSELKRCFINGLRAYSKTDDGRRYTLEWNVESTSSGRTDTGMTYGETGQTTADNWYQSPVQSNPLSVFPESVRSQVVSDINDTLPDSEEIRVDQDLDPFSREAYEYLRDTYSEDGTDNLFSQIIDDKHCRVTEYTVQPGHGIGILNPGDSGSEQELLVGSWIPSLLKELGSRGQKNPQAFSYDGLVSQGNGGLSIIEEADKGHGMFDNLLTLPDEGQVKLDSNIWMDIDTVLFLISNVSLTSRIESLFDGQVELVRSFSRRLSEHKLGYLLSFTREAELLRRELIDNSELWTESDIDARVERAQRSAQCRVVNDSGIVERELAPHTIEAAAMFDVASRFSTTFVETTLNSVDRALLYETGSTIVSGDEFTVDNMSSVGSQADVVDNVQPDIGVPVTFTRDVLYDLMQSGVQRQHQTYDVGAVITPSDVLSEISDAAKDNVNETILPGNESSAMEVITIVREYIQRQQEQDILESMLADKRVGDEGITEYLQHVYASVADETVTVDTDEVITGDSLTMKTFEVELFGLFSSDEYAQNGTNVSDTVSSWRQDIVDELQTRNYRGHDGDSFWDVTSVRNTLYDDDWELVENIYENFNPQQWEDPPEGSQTAELKQKTITYMVDQHGYTSASAELTTRSVFQYLEDNGQWD